MARSAIRDVSTAVGAGGGAGDASRLAVALTIVSHPALGRAGERVVLPLAGGAVGVSRNAPDFAWPGRAFGAPLGDPFLGRKPLRFAAGSPGSVLLQVDAGSTPVIAGAPVTASAEFAAEHLAQGVPLELAERVVVLLHRIDLEVADTADPMGMVGTSAAIRRVRGAIERVADLAVPVLIRGETGTGKELVARAIHDRSPRRGGPFVSVNLGAIPRELAAAELFGAVRGAFTGATRDRDGLFRAAHGGTLFLDEVGEAPPEVQVMLLRVLETGELYAVGGDRPVAIQVRLIAATDADLEDGIRDGRFKAPLLHRLAGYEVRLPPLRERREDIGILLHHFAREELAAVGELDRLSPADPYAAPWLPAPLAARLVRHAWPGNVRQLRNVVRQLVIDSRGLPQLRLDPRLAEDLAAPPDLATAVAPPAPVPQLPAGAPSPRSTGAPRRKPAEVTEAELMEALHACTWDLKAVADRLRIPRPSVYALIDRCPGIRTAGDLGADEIARCFRDCGGDLDAMVARLQVSKRALARRVKELGLTPRS